METGEIYSYRTEVSYRILVNRVHMFVNPRLYISLLWKPLV